MFKVSDYKADVGCVFAPLSRTGCKILADLLDILVRPGHGTYIEYALLVDTKSKIRL